MEPTSSYEALGGSPPVVTRNHYFPPSTPQAYSDDSDDDQMHLQAPWWKRAIYSLVPDTASHALPPQSGYLTLIPLSDSRLKPQRTKLIMGTLLLATMALVCAVYFLVSRGVNVGTIGVKSSRIAFNTSESTYVVVLQAHIPIYNPNYLGVMVAGTVNVSFYDQNAGSTTIQETYIPAKSEPFVLELQMDATSLPKKYLYTIATQCLTFPEKLIFFLTGRLEATYLGKKYQMDLDNYFIISCRDGHRAAEQAKEDEDETALGRLLLRPVDEVPHLLKPPAA